MSGIFITATDTDVGKTVITGAIGAALRIRGMKIGVMKPLASGGVTNNIGKLISTDATFIMEAAGISEDERDLVNPLCLSPALTPAVAAIVSGIQVDIPAVLKAYEILNKKYDSLLVEGVGGITAPLWQDYLTVDLMLELALPAIVVTRPNLGTINHTVLTVEYARQRGVEVAGIIINGWNESEMGILEKSNEDYISRLTKIPILGKFPYSPQIAAGDVQAIELARLGEKYLRMDEIISITQRG